MSERLFETLVSSGLPVAYLVGSKDNLSVVYNRQVTSEESNLYSNIVNNFDWSSHAENQWVLNKNKTNAIDLILDQTNPQVIATRNSQRIAMDAFHSQILKINEIVDYLNNNGASISGLSPPIGWPTLINALKLQIINESSPGD